jgi:hypothetical protein
LKLVHSFQLELLNKKAWGTLIPCSMLIITPHWLLSENADTKKGDAW